MVRFSLLVFALVSGCFSADYSVADAEACVYDEDCPRGTVCTVGYCVRPHEGWQPTEARCGDGVVSSGEACDDGNDDDTDACTNQCLEARCGDGYLRTDLSPGETGYEACDDGNQIDREDACRNICEEHRCGDRIVAPDGSEECDDGNTVSDDGCSESCLEERCGDGVVQSGEACDDGNPNDEDACRNTCEEARCGDSVLYVGEEACDDGNDNDEDACRNNCEDAFCGDGVLHVGVEACDDGNQTDDDECRNDCEAPACGDGIVDEGEACDDGNESNEDACIAECQSATCGDGFVHRGEEACEPQVNQDCDQTCGWVPGASQEGAVRDCLELRFAILGASNGSYWIDPDGGSRDNAFLAYCQMSEDAGGWTRVINLFQNETTWNAWDTEINRNRAWESDQIVSLPMELFSETDDGEDLEFMFQVNQQRVGPIYRGVDKRAWNPSLGMGDFDSHFQFRIHQEAWQDCHQPLGRDTSKWSWSIAKPGMVQANCANYSHQGDGDMTGNGFLLEGTDNNPDQAYMLNGLNAYRATANFGWLRVYVRRTIN